MSLIRYVERLRRMDSLISMMATGSPGEFADKMGIKRSTLFQYLQEMRELGVCIEYSYIRRSYYYPDGRRLRIRIESQELTAKKSDYE